MVKTHPDNLKSEQALNAYKIWVRKCDNYRFVTLLPKDLVPKESDPNEPIEVLDKFYMVQPERYAFETHDNLTYKLYSSIKYVYSKFPNYDWYHISDDDAYVNLNNFRTFLYDKNPAWPITYGFEFKTIVPGGYHSGGPGYVLSNEAFKRIGLTLTRNISECPNSGVDDIDANACLRQLNVSMGVSVDKRNRQRFLSLDLGSHFFGDYPDWMYEYSLHPIQKVILTYFFQY